MKDTKTGATIDLETAVNNGRIAVSSVKFVLRRKRAKLRGKEKRLNYDRMASSDSDRLLSRPAVLQ